jgi:RNA polymerase sigma factor (sigma-70 family)
MSTIEFGELMMCKSQLLKPFAFRLTRDSEKAGELVQETVYRAMVHREKFHAGTNVQAWLFSIMRNTYIDGYRRNKRTKKVFTEFPSTFQNGYFSECVKNSTECHLQYKEINRLIHQLPVILKTSFLLYAEGFRYHEIAVAINEPLGTVKSRIFMARKILKEQINRN